MSTSGLDAESSWAPSSRVLFDCFDLDIFDFLFILRFTFLVLCVISLNGLNRFGWGNGRLPWSTVGPRELLQYQLVNSLRHFLINMHRNADRDGTSKSEISVSGSTLGALLVPVDWTWTCLSVESCLLLQENSVGLESSFCDAPADKRAGNP